MSYLLTSQFSAYRGALTRKIDDCPKRLNQPPGESETEELRSCLTEVCQLIFEPVTAESTRSYCQQY